MPQTPVSRARWAFATLSILLVGAWLLTKNPSGDRALQAASAGPPPGAATVRQLTKPVALVKPSRTGAASSTKAPSIPKLKSPKAPKAKFRPREVVVLFAADTSASERAALRAKVDATDFEDLGAGGEQLTLRAGASTKQAVAELERSKNVVAADRNAVFTAAVAPNDPLYPTQRSLSSPFDTDIDAEEGWAASTDATATVPVAVIDTGVDFSHPDLANTAWTNPGETGTASNGSNKQSNGVDDDANGKIDDWRGWDFVNADKDPTDDQGHGSHVAGIIAAQRGNGIGIAGVSSQARIMALKTLGADGSGDVGASFQAISYAIAAGAKVVNGSYGTSYDSNVIRQLVSSATGVSFVFAAGNDGVNLDTYDAFPCEIPGAQVICVGSVSETGAASDFSNYSPSSVDITAPGENINSTVPANLYYGGYAKFSGTSMATPVVAGAAAVLRSKFPTLTAAQIRARLQTGADPVVTPNSAIDGRVNLAGAIANAPIVPTTTATAAVATGRLTYTATAGTTNTVTVTGSGSAFTLKDTGVASITPGAGCSAAGTQTVSCTGITAITINTDDREDAVTAAVAVPVTVNAGTGLASITTGTGADNVTTAEGNDDIHTGDGNDTITSGAGDDVVDPGNGDDTVNLGDGADKIFHPGGIDPADGNDTINAGAGNDYVMDYAGNNTVHGDAGDDNISNSSGTDHVYGDDGVDRLAATGTNDVIDGGAGDDWIWAYDGTGSTLVGGTGRDMVSFGETDAEDPVQITLGGSSGNGAEGQNYTIASDVEDAMGGRGDDLLIGSSGSNRLIGHMGDDTLFGNGGDDVIDQWLDNVDKGNDIVDGGSGNDTVEYESALGAQIFGRGDDGVTVTIDGIANDGNQAAGEADNVRTNVENVTGTNGPDIITGSSVANTLVGRGGNDVLDGRGGTDVYVGDLVGNAPCDGVDCVIGTKDAVSYSTQTAAVTASLDGLANDGLAGENENIPSSVEKLVGGQGADTLTAGTYPALLDGGLGADTIRGGSANDVLFTNDGVVDAVIECKGGTGDSVLKDSTDVVNADCESVRTSDTPDTILTSGPETASYVNKATYTFTSTTPNSRFECGVAETVPELVFAPCTSPWTVPQQANGDVRVYKIRAISETGVTDPSSVIFALWWDTVAPDTTITGGPAYGATVLTPTVSIPFTSTGETVTYQCRYDLGAWNTCTSPYTTPTITAGEHEVWVRTKDAVGNFGSPTLTQFKRAAQQLTVPAGGVGSATPALTSDATYGTSLDWIHWKGAASTAFDRKNATQQISTWSAVGGGTPSLFTSGFTYSWTDALGGTPAGSATTGVANGAADGRGFKFTAPATNAAVRKLRVFVGVRGATATGTLKVYFNGQTPLTQSATAVSDTTAAQRVYTIDYRAFAPTDTLNVEWVQTTGGTAPAAAAVLYAAALY